MREPGDLSGLDNPTLVDLAPPDGDDVTDVGPESVTLEQIKAGPVTEPPPLEAATEVDAGRSDPVEDPVSVEVLSAFAPESSEPPVPRARGIARPSPSQIARAVAETPTLKAEKVPGDVASSRAASPAPKPEVSVAPKEDAPHGSTADCGSYPTDRFEPELEPTAELPFAPDHLRWIVATVAAVAVALYLLMVFR